jgi:octaprenyl-diphosphate synthase
LPPTEAEALRTLLGSTDANRRAKVRAALDAVGAIDTARRQAEEFAQAARNALECLPRSECRAILEQLTDWAIRREK